MTIVHDLVDAMQRIAPPELAADWDNTGLLVGASDWPADSVLLTIDLTWEVLQEAIDKQVNAIVAYHPPIFAPLAAVTDAGEKQRIILEAIRAGIAIHSPHTGLDAAPGGVNDWLAEALAPAPGSVRPLEAHAHLPPGEANKLVTMCPADAVSTVHQAMSEAGAGVIGEYTQCSFRLPGDGTFYAGDAANPAVGKKGRVEHVEEVRLEMVCSNAALAGAIAALRAAHPYEEPPIEVYALSARPDASVGQGRLVTLDEPLALDEIVERLKAHLGVEHLKVAVGRDAPARHAVVGLCAGAGGSLLDAALRAGAELFLTGEMRHHDALDAVARGCTVILAGHTNTERGYLPRLAESITARLEGVRVVISERDAAPFSIR